MSMINEWIQTHTVLPSTTQTMSTPLYPGLAYRA